MILFDFQCPDGHVHEHLVDRDTRAIECTTCGKIANRIISPVRAYLEPFSGAFPTAADQWEKRRSQHMNWERKQEASKGRDWYKDRIK